MGKRTIEKILQNEKYIGRSVYYKTYNAEYPEKRSILNEGQHKKLQVDDHHPAIIDQETFDQVQAAIAKRKRVKKEMKW